MFCFSLLFFCFFCFFAWLWQFLWPRAGWLDGWLAGLMACLVPFDAWSPHAGWQPGQQRWPASLGDQALQGTRQSHRASQPASQRSFQSQTERQKKQKNTREKAEKLLIMSVLHCKIHVIQTCSVVLFCFFLLFLCFLLGSGNFSGRGLAGWMAGWLALWLVWCPSMPGPPMLAGHLASKGGQPAWGTRHCRAPDKAIGPASQPAREVSSAKQKDRKTEKHKRKSRKTLDNVSFTL